MISLQKRHQGFTIVELLIVIVVIGILALLVITTYGGIQQRARNAKRQNDMQSLQTHLESFYAVSGYYPSLTDMNSASWIQTHMASLDLNALVDPLNPSKSQQLAASPVSKQYAYEVTDSAGASCEGSDTSCAKYTLTATFEGSVNGSNTYSKSNLD